MKKYFLAPIGALAMLFALPMTSTSAVVPTSPIPEKIIGMSAPADLWNTRVSEVGACGVEARRIFANLSSDGTGGKNTTIRQAVAAGQMPIVSYKVPSVTTLNRGGYARWLTATRNYLNSLGVQVTATFHHEPNPDITGAQFRAGSTKFLALKSPTIAVGPILNGWLLDNRVSTFASYTDKSLLTAWDFVGIDIYQAGSASNPGVGAARGVTNLETWMDGQGFGDKPLGIGEYNGYTASSIAAAGEAILATPEVWFGLVFNSANGGKGNVLHDDQITAYQNTKADVRASHTPAC